VKPSSTLPALPTILLRRVDAAQDPPAFLRLQRVWLRARFPKGAESAPFGYDSVTRRALDAVVIVAWKRFGNQVAVYLRSAVRPPLLERAAHPAAVGREAQASLWELPAGLIEPDDAGGVSAPEETIRRAAARETAEELGFVIPEDRFEHLGYGVHPAPAMTAERQFFVHVELKADQPTTPSLDGSALEEHAEICLVWLHDALRWCDEGVIVDGKTELALRRLASRLVVRG
jgi:ADP-ribose pyrophosphatase